MIDCEKTRFEGGRIMLKKHNIEDQRGFTLIEVVTSVLIIGILLVALAQIFIQTNKTAVKNNEKLILMNLANAELERLKLTGTKFTSIGEIKESTSDFQNYKVKVENKACESSQNCTNLKLYNVAVTVQSDNSQTKASVEGFVPYEK